MRIIGLTGGIASGKSSVAKLMEGMGAKVIDADQLAREAVEPGTPAYKSIVSRFGRDILKPDLTIDRKALGRIIFADPSARKELEQITHPAIARLAEMKLAELRDEGTEIVVYMAPLLIEAGVTSRVNEIWVVYVDQETQICRVMKRDGISREEALQRISAQMPMERKRKLGKVVIDNSGSMENTELQLRSIWQREFGRACNS